MSIWFKNYKIEIKDSSINNEIFIGIEFLEIGEIFKARMPVDKRTKQPLGLLHGGASCVLAESTAALLLSSRLIQEKNSVGLNLNANHIKTTTSGYVYACAKPLVYW